MSQPGIVPFYRAIDSNGTPIPNARLYTFLTGTTTAAPVYTTSALSVSHGAYVQANSAGLFPAFYLDPAVTYRFQLRISPYSAAVSGYDFDPVSASASDSIAYIPGGSGADTTTVQAALRRIVNAADFGFATTNTGTQNATKLGEAVTYLSSGGVINISPGTFPLNTTTLTAGLTIQGAGMGVTIITQGTTATSYGIFYAESSGSGTFIDNITIRDLTLYNSAGTFSEFIHLLAFAGVRNLLIERVTFKGFRGDGLCLHTQALSDSTERHNVNITVRDCVFDGVNNNNRNGVSIIDGTTVRIENCTFKTCTTSTMPGAIDAEPDQSYSVIKDIEVRGCRFENVGGNLGTVSLYVDSAVTALPVGFRVIGCSFYSSDDDGADIYVDVDRLVTAADVDMAVYIDGNEGKDGYIPFDIRSAKGVTITASNTFQDYTRPSQIGFNGATDAFMDVHCEANLIRCGTAAVADLAGLFIGAGTGLDLGGRYYKCGPAAADGYPIRLIASVTSAKIRLLASLDITLATSQVNAIEASSHTQTPAGNRIDRGVNLGGGVSEFQARAPGQVLPPVNATYNPGSLATAASTTIQTMTVTGAALGDDVKVAFSVNLAGAELIGWVSAADTVSYYFTNTNGANPLDLAEGTVTATVTKSLYGAL